MGRKAIITNLKTGEKQESLDNNLPEGFETLEDFISHNGDQGVYGLPDRWIPGNILTEEAKAEAINTRQVDDPNNMPGQTNQITEYFFPKEYSVEYFSGIEDATNAGMDEELRKDDDTCKALLNLIRRYNKKNLESSTIGGLLVDPALQPIINAIQLGAVPQLRGMIAQSGPNYYPPEMVDEALAILDARIAERPA